MKDRRDVVYELKSMELIREYVVACLYPPPRHPPATQSIQQYDNHVAEWDDSYASHAIARAPAQPNTRLGCTVRVSDSLVVVRSTYTLNVPTKSLH